MIQIEQDVQNSTLDSLSLSSALDAMAMVIGNHHIKRARAELDEAAKATIPDPQRPAAVVYPGSTEEVAAIVKIAGKCRIALWPCGKGKNYGYGSATPVLKNTVVLHLERLNRILEINEELAYAVIEPGVTYRQLKEHLELHHPALWCDCTDGPPDGSVIGNALDRGCGVTHYADHFGTLCGLEVVLADGSVVQSGGGPKDGKTWHTHKWGTGPYLEGLFTQANYGVVTKAGIWLMPKPAAFCSFQFDLAHEKDLPQLIDIIRELMLTGVLQAASHIVNDIVGLSVLTQYPAPLLDKYSRLPDEIRHQMCDRYSVLPWGFGGGIQGSKASVRLVKRELRKRLASLGKIVFIDERMVAVAKAVNRLAAAPGPKKPVTWMLRKLTGKSLEMLALVPHIHSLMQGTPSDYFVRHAYFKSRIQKPEITQPDRDDCGLIWFAPIVPMTGRHVEEVMKICQPLFKKYDFDFYVALLTQNPRSMIVLMSIFFLKDNPEQVHKAALLYDALSQATADAGYPPYRASIPGMRKLADMAPEFNALTARLKEALDPAHILAPGKYGIY